MMTRASYLIGSSAFVVAVAAPLAPAMAQDAAPAPQGAPSTRASEDGSGEEIIVTARKRTERLQDVPGSIIATQAEQIRDLRITDVQTLSQYVPSFTQSIASPNPRFYLRGVGSGSNASFEQAVGSFSDGVYRGRGILARIPYFDLESVDVQLGPQVVLYGNSTTGGAINVRSRRPNTEFEVYLDASYEFRNNETTLQSAVNVPLSDRVQFRAAGYLNDLNHGWLRTSRPLINPPNETNDPRVDDLGARLSLAVQPTADLDIVFRYEVVDTENLGGTLQIGANLSNLPFVESNFDLFRESGTSSPPWPDYRNEDFVRLNSQTVIAEVNYDLGAGRLTSITGYNWFDYDADQDPDQTRLSILQFVQVERYKQFSQELRYAFDIGGSVDFIVGGYYQRSRLNRTVRTDVNFAALGLPFPSFTRTGYLRQKQEDVSAFADATIRFSPQFTLELGARYSHVEKSGDQGSNPTNFATTTFNPAFLTLYGAFFAIPHDLLDLKLSENHFMPEAILQYRPVQNVMLYARVVRGAKAGGFDDQYAGDVTTGTARRSGPNSVAYRPETATSFEAGIRYETDDRTLQLGLTGYHVRVEDLQVGVFNGRTNFVVGNADSRSNGVEAFVNYRPTSTLTLNGVLSYVDAKYTDFKGAACTAAQSLVSSTCSQDLSGTRVPVPDWMFNIGVTHRLPIGNYILRSQAHWNHRAAYNFSDTQDPLLNRPPVNLVDASIGFGPEDGRWEVVAFAKNILDERWADVGGSTPLVRGAVFSDTQRPFQAGLRVRINFGR